MSFPYGQCTWWCAEQKPWVLRCDHLGNAKDWAANWRSIGGFVQMTPAVGAVACFQPFCDGADAVYGHVAVVIAVSGSVFTVSEMNGPAGPGRVDDRVCKDAPGVSFLRDSTPLPPTPVPLGGSDDMWLYQDAANTIWLVSGGTMIALGDPADVRVYLGIGVKQVTHTQLSAVTQERLGKLPKIV